MSCAPTTGQELYEHVQALAQDMDIAVWACMTCPAGYGEARFDADSGYRMVMLTEIPDEPATYLVALHELGHHADPKGWRRGLQLDREAFAWRWALGQAKVRMNRWAWTAVKESLDSYDRDRRYKNTRAFEQLLQEVNLHVCGLDVAA